MSELEVRIVRLDPMAVAYTHGFGPQPEGLAWDALLPWAKSKGLLDDLKVARFFGFNNPNPSPGSPNYGYEQWIVVKAGMEPEGDVKIKDFHGGLYAVTRCRLGDIGAAWKRLAAWREDSPYKWGQHQWLEECLNPQVFVTPEGQFQLPESVFDDAEFDIYLPIAE